MSLEHRESQPSGEPQRERPPVEIELKVVDLGPLPDFIKKIEQSGAKLVVPRRLLHDEAFKLSKEFRSGEARSFFLPTDLSTDKVQLGHALEILGLKLNGESENKINLERPSGELPRRTTRLRRDGEQLYWTVKKRRKADGATVDHRQEANVSISDPSAVSELLVGLGYKLNSVREKYRTSYDLAGALVEVNEGPVAPPWVEVEAEDEATVLNTITQLGYGLENTARISDAAYYRGHGVPEEKLRNLVFEQPVE